VPGTFLLEWPLVSALASPAENKSHIKNRKQTDVIQKLYTQSLNMLGNTVKWAKRERERRSTYISDG